MNATPSRKPGLSIRLDVTQLHGILRVDQIRHDTLVALVQHWASDEARADIIAQLDALADAVTSPRDGELDALIENVESAAAMDNAETRIDLYAALRLRTEFDTVIAKLFRFNPAAGRRAS